MITARAQDPVTDEFASRASRRIAVGMLYGSYAAGWLAAAVMWHAAAAPLRIAGLSLLLVAFFVGGTAFWRLMRRTFVNAPNLPDRDLDERQRERTYRALRAGYPMLAVICCIAPLYILVATTAERWTVLRDSTVLLGLGWGLCLLALTLPTAILAWNEPDPLADDG